MAPVIGLVIAIVAADEFAHLWAFTLSSVLALNDLAERDIRNATAGKPPFPCGMARPQIAKDLIAAVRRMRELYLAEKAKNETGWTPTASEAPSDAQNVRVDSARSLSFDGSSTVSTTDAAVASLPVAANA